MFFLLFAAVTARKNGEQQTIDPLVAIQQLRAFQQWSEEKKILDQIIEQQGKQADVLIYRLRAEALVNLDMPEEALDDIEIALRKYPNQEESKNLNMLAAAAHIKVGDAEQAELEAEASEDAHMIKQSKEFTKLLTQADEYYDDENFEEAARTYDKILPTCTHAYSMMQKRMEIAWILGQTKVYEEKAKPLIKNFDDDTEMHFRYGVSMICNGKFGDGIKYLEQVKDMDDPPDNISKYERAATTGSNMLKQINKAADNKSFKEAYQLIDKFNKSVISICSVNSGISAKVNTIKAKIYIKEGKLEEAIECLDKAVEIDQENVDYIKLRAETLLKNKDYDAAIFDYARLQKMKPNDSGINRALQRAHEAKQRANRVDYYAVLGVPKGCNLNQIKDGYRKLVRKWHPDRYPGKEEKKNAEKMMKSINTAFDVLSDADKRRYYDAGGDMEQYQAYLDQQKQQQSAGDPFENLRKMQEEGQTFVFE